MHRHQITGFVILLLASFYLTGGLALGAYPVASDNAQATQLVWEIERVEDVHELVEKMGDHAAVYDATGALHVAYGGDHLYYAHCVGSTCTVETVDDSDYVGMYASLALDSQGNPHIAYYDTGLMDSCDDEKVKYAVWDDTQWTIQVVDQGCTGKYPSIAVDMQGVPHVSYFDEVSDDLQLADWDGSAWHTYTPYWLPSFEFSGYPSSLLADHQGRLHLAFIAGHPGEPTVWYTRKVDDTWESLVEVDTQPGASGLSMAIDIVGNAHLSYHHTHFDADLNNYVSKLRYTYFNGTAWQPALEIGDMDYLGWTSVMVGADTYPRLAYKANGSAAYVARTMSGWGTPAAVPDSDGVERMYLGQGAYNSLGLTFYDGGVLKQVHSDPPLFIWSTPAMIDSTGWVGYHIALAASDTGDLHVVYTDEDEKQLRYAYRPTGGAWQLQTLLQTAEDYFIRSTDIDLDTNGRPQIVYQEYYYVNMRSVLKYVRWTGSVWNQMGTVSQADHGGCAPSLALDAANIIYIAYNDCDYIHDNLVLASYDGSWHYQTVDPDEGTSSASLHVNNLGFLYISYHLPEYPAGTLRYAKKESSINWTIEDVTTTSATNTSLALDSTGKPRIAFAAGYDPDFTVKHAAWDGQQWLIEPVTTTTYWNEVRLAIDAQDRSHLAFMNWHHPAYAVKDGATWQITDPIDAAPADPDYSPSQTISLDIDFGADGLPVILYDGELDLKIADQNEKLLLLLPIVMKN